MSEQVKLKDIPCMVCNKCRDCEKKIEQSPRIKEIKDVMMVRTDGQFEKCGIWIALNAPEMVDETEGEDEW